MIDTTWKWGLFGGAIFAAGIAQADTIFEYVNGPIAGYAAAGEVVIDGSSYTDTAYEPTGIGYALAIAGYQSCGGYGYVYQYTRGNVFMFSDFISVRADAYNCVGGTARGRAYFQIFSPTEFALGWSGGLSYQGITVGVWQLDTLGTATLVAGPGIDAQSSYVREEFTLDPGLYYFEADVFTDGSGFEGGGIGIGMLGLLGDACSCDLDGSGSLNIDDIDTFVSAFLAGDLAVDFDGSGTLNLDDIDAFVACFLGGCG
ncbi:MAG: hypothetical protein RIB60_00805 [Phycisphaerales bacterium]